MTAQAMPEESNGINRSETTEEPIDVEVDAVEPEEDADLPAEEATEDKPAE